jgi:hypothetical protein
MPGKDTRSFEMVRNEEKVKMWLQCDMVIKAGQGVEDRVETAKMMRNDDKFLRGRMRS